MSPLREIRAARSEELDQAHWLNRHRGKKGSKLSPYEERAFEIAELLEHEQIVSLVFTGNERKIEAHRNFQGIRKYLKILGFSISTTYVETNNGEYVLLIKSCPEEK